MKWSALSEEQKLLTAFCVNKQEQVTRCRHDSYQFLSFVFFDIRQAYESGLPYLVIA